MKTTEALQANTLFSGEGKLCKDVISFRRALMMNSKDYNAGSEQCMKLTKSLCEPGEKIFNTKIHKKYYRYPNINLSRDKMDNVKTKYGIKKVLAKDNSDFKIIGTKFIEKMFNINWRMSLSSLQSYSALIIKSKPLFKNDEAYQIMYGTINKLIEEYGKDYPVVCSVPHYYNGGGLKGDPYGIFYDNYNELMPDKEYTILIKDDCIEHYEDIYNANSQNIYVSDVFMNNLASEDSLVLSAKDYKNIRALLKSTSKEDRAVGMSIMSNCNIMKSKTYLSLLFFHFSDTLRAESLWNQVAFKSLRREFEKYVLEYNHYHSNRYSQCMTYLAEDGALTVNAAEHLISIMFEAVINGSTGINESRSVFMLDKASVKLTPEVKARIRNNEDLSQIALEMQSDLPF